MAITAAPTREPKEDDTADFGDYASTEDEEIDVEDAAEPWHNYDVDKTSRVFYPLCVGEVLNERYLIEHKIGFGGFSTVWMAHDLHDKKDVALKVLSLGEWGEHETRMQNEIMQNVQDVSHLVTYLETFLLPRNSSKCHHRVLVFPLMGPCLTPLILGNMCMTTRMSAAKQLLEALGNLHKAGIVHRDLNERNCMWSMSPLHNLSRTKKYEVLGRPLKEVIPSVDLWKKGELVQPISIPEDLRTDKFSLGDFGLAMKLGDSVIQHGYPPMQFCSPERLHRQEPSFACDMWSYLIIFSQLYLGFPPFPTWLKGGPLAGMVKCLGPLPEQWKGLYTHVEPEDLDTWYDQCTRPDPKHDLAAEIAYRRPEADSTERKHVLSILSRGLSYSPEKRLTATQLLQDSSFKAVMSKYCG